MAKIISIDILKCVSGKFGGDKSKKYFATNKHTLKFNTIVKTSPIDTKFLLGFLSLTLSYITFPPNYL